MLPRARLTRPSLDFWASPPKWRISQDFLLKKGPKHALKERSTFNEFLKPPAASLCISYQRYVSKAFNRGVSYLSTFFIKPLAVGCQLMAESYFT